MSTRCLETQVVHAETSVANVRRQWWIVMALLGLAGAVAVLALCGGTAKTKVSEARRLSEGMAPRSGGALRGDLAVNTTFPSPRGRGDRRLQQEPGRSPQATALFWHFANVTGSPPPGIPPDVWRMEEMINTIEHILMKVFMCVHTADTGGGDVDCPGWNDQTHTARFPAAEMKTFLQSVLTEYTTMHKLAMLDLDEVHDAINIVTGKVTAMNQQLRSEEEKDAIAKEVAGTSSILGACFSWCPGVGLAMDALALAAYATDIGLEIEAANLMKQLPGQIASMGDVVVNLPQMKVVKDWQQAVKYNGYHYTMMEVGSYDEDIRAALFAVIVAVQMNLVKDHNMTEPLHAVTVDLMLAWIEKYAAPHLAMLMITNKKYPFPGDYLEAYTFFVANLTASASQDVDSPFTILTEGQRALIPEKHFDDIPTINLGLVLFMVFKDVGLLKHYGFYGNKYLRRGERWRGFPYPEPPRVRFNGQVEVEVFPEDAPYRPRPMGVMQQGRIKLRKFTYEWGNTVLRGLNVLAGIASMVLGGIQWSTAQHVFNAVEGAILSVRHNLTEFYDSVVQAARDGLYLDCPDDNTTTASPNQPCCGETCPFGCSTAAGGGSTILSNGCNGSFVGAEDGALCDPGAGGAVCKSGFCKDLGLPEKDPVCAVEKASRADCGPGGIDHDGCVSRGCCWQPPYDPNVPRIDCGGGMYVVDAGDSSWTCRDPSTWKDRSSPYAPNEGDIVLCGGFCSCGTSDDSKSLYFPRACGHFTEIGGVFKCAGHWQKFEDWLGMGGWRCEVGIEPWCFFKKSTNHTEVFGVCAAK